MKVIAFGDIHMDCRAIKKIPDLEHANLVIITGDLTNFGGRKEALRILEEIRGINPRCYAIHGNLDLPEVNDLLSGLEINLHSTGIIQGDIGLFGVGGSNITPFNTPSEYTEEEISEFVNRAYECIQDAPIKVLISHAPPYGTVTDQLNNGMHVGSKAIREFIEKYQPDFCFTGHIHEARGKDTIGQSLILNPGMLIEPGWIEFESKENGNYLARLNRT